MPRRSSSGAVIKIVIIALILLLVVAFVAWRFFFGGAFSGRVRALPNLVALKQSDPVPLPKTDSYVPVNIRLSNMRMVRAPQDWKIVEIGRFGENQPTNEGVKLEVTNARGFGPVKCIAVHPMSFEYDEELRVAMNLAFMWKRPDFTLADLRKKYPTDRDIVAAFTRLSPGDPAKGGRLLNRIEQEECVLALTSSYTLGPETIPSRVTSEYFDFFLGGVFVSCTDELFCIVIAFPRGVNKGSYLEFSVPDPGQDKLVATKRQLAQFAVTFAACLEEDGSDRE